ncbi:MAG: sterol desaturase family protein [Blastocatellia bacterium]|nr:sterol desaturase family protein [Blastocatellia bacterium]MCS7158148.1 sterol desaturase family protein [Blastocatellia bacterium]MCX7752989.1 sterol desaturase family protein [Blastocatellia bacterium]MDW8168512.1 sterol desaturase family protein [Acidobacteriota bacterium]MDW8256926.1 sterol desaturase family protein [Acidobacteriota bacterium]
MRQNRDDHALGWFRACRAHFRPFFFYAGGGIVLGAAAVGQAPSAWPSLLGLAIVGLLLWSLLEYVIHRGLHIRARSARMRAFLYLAHGVHHEASHVVGSNFIRFSASASVSAFFFLLFLGILGSWPKAVTLLLGLWGGYLFYEFTHYVAHFGNPRTPWMRAMRRHHQRHHQEGERTRFGVTTPLWDWLLGTL